MYDFRIKHILINFTKINIPHIIYTNPMSKLTEHILSQLYPIIIYGTTQSVKKIKSTMRVDAQ